MPLEDADYISQLNPAWPTGSDGVNTSDDHHRNTKKATQQSFPNISGEVTATQDDLNILAGAAVNGSPTNPVGTILQGAWASAPDGYLACDGTAINPTYTELIALVGASTPDLRGRFIRGWSQTSDIDPDGPRAALTQQVDALQSHTHAYTDFLVQPGTGLESGGEYSPLVGDPRDTTEPSAPARTAIETRPYNAALMFVIKW